MSLPIPAWDFAETETRERGHVCWHFVLVEATLLLVVAFAVAEPVAAVFFLAGVGDHAAGGGCDGLGWDGLG